MKIKSITFKDGYPTVRFSNFTTVWQDGVSPGQDNDDDVAPMASFVEAVEALVEGFKELDLPDYDWQLTKLELLWNAESTAYGYRAVIEYYKPETDFLMAPKLQQKSPDLISPILDKKLERVREEAVKFAQGKTASSQLNLLENDQLKEGEAA